jgi:hypothetical protein
VTLPLDNRGRYPQGYGHCYHLHLVGIYSNIFPLLQMHGGDVLLLPRIRGSHADYAYTTNVGWAWNILILENA